MSGSEIMGDHEHDELAQVFLNFQGQSGRSNSGTFHFFDLLRSQRAYLLARAAPLPAMTISDK